MVSFWFFFVSFFLSVSDNYYSLGIRSSRLKAWYFPGRFRFGHNIIYNRCLHETGMKNAQTGLKSSRPLDRADDYLQTRTNLERDKCEHKYISDRSQLCSLLRNNACSTKRCKKNNNDRQENKSKDMWFSYRSHVNMLRISIFIPVQVQVQKYTFTYDIEGQFYFSLILLYL